MMELKMITALILFSGAVVGGASAATTTSLAASRSDVDGRGRLFVERKRRHPVHHVGSNAHVFQNKRGVQETSGFYSSTFISSSSAVLGFCHQQPTRLRRTTRRTIGDPILPAPTETKKRISSLMNRGQQNLQSSFSSSETPGNPSVTGSARRFVQHRDVVIIGGGLAGLSIALYLSQLDPHRHVTVLDRESQQNGQHQSDAKPGKETTVASWAAAGMLAPHAERLPQGPLLKLCEESRQFYPDFVDMVETLAQQSGEEGAKYLAENKQKGPKHLEPWEVGYMATGGFLAPAFAGDAVATWAPPQTSDKSSDTWSPSAAVWLDAHQVREMEPQLHPDVIGGWWFPNDASVDARRLTRCLQAACVAAGVQLLQGPAYQVSSLDFLAGSKDDGTRGKNSPPTSRRAGAGIRLKSGNTVTANTIVLANGAWMQELLPVPIEPHKGQSVALRMPATADDGSQSTSPPILRRVLFAQDCYIVPKADGRRVIVGATVEAGSWDSNVTPAGLLHVLSHAIQLLPALRDWPIEETWVGLRPTTPDKLPLLGRTPWPTVYMAGGYWRNGVLLAPKTGKMMAELILADSKSSKLGEQDEEFLSEFAWDRFTSPNRSLRVAANSRYAAALHPLQRRTDRGKGSAVGTELGSYSTARSAQSERKQDREQLFSGNSDIDDIFEQAATMGKQDGQAYHNFQGNMAAPGQTETSPVSQPQKQQQQHELLQGSAVDPTRAGTGSDSSNSNDEDVDHDLNSLYAKIEANKRKRSDDERPEGGAAKKGVERPDPGFRLHHVDEETGEETEVPPYTRPAEFLEQLQLQKQRGEVPAENDDSSYNESTFDGYTVIQKSSSELSREEQLQAMREARLQNRKEETDENKVGVVEPDTTPETVQTSSTPTNLVSEVAPSHKEQKSETPTDQTNEDSDLKTFYDKVRANKEATSIPVKEKLGEHAKASNSERPDPGFRIYHIDEDTGEEWEVPPYTRPAEFFEHLQLQKRKQQAPAVQETISGGAASNPSASDISSEEISDKSNGKDDDSSYNEGTFDGYTVIQKASSELSREEQLQAMRETRLQNRNEETDEDKVGVVEPDTGLERPQTSSMPPSPDAASSPANVANENSDLKTFYDKIRANKEAASTPAKEKKEEKGAFTNERLDPGFRIIYVDEETGEEWEVPPYTRPAEFFEQLQKQKAKLGREKTSMNHPAPNGSAADRPEESANGHSTESKAADTDAGSSPTESSGSTYDESTYDGYTVIQKSNSELSREEQLQAMREARLRNRQEETDKEQIGAVEWDNSDNVNAASQNINNWSHST